MTYRASTAMRRFGPRLGAHRTARRNLERAYPGRPPAEIAVVLDGMWENLGRNIREFPHLRRMLEDPDVVEVARTPPIEALPRPGAPVPFAGAPPAPWEDPQSGLYGASVSHLI